MSEEKKLIRECLDWLIEFQVTSNLNDCAWEELGNLIDRCHDTIKSKERKD
jgi:hypothetical protein